MIGFNPYERATMKLSAIAVDAAVIEQGEWVGDLPEMGDLRLKVRGANNADWRRLQAKLMAAVPRQRRAGGRIDPDESDRITAACLQSACLIDWDGLENEDGSPLPYSKAAASDLLTKPEYRAFRDAVLWAANVVGEAVTADKDTSEKNSGSASPGT